MRRLALHTETADGRAVKTPKAAADTVAKDQRGRPSSAKPSKSAQKPAATPK